MNTLFKSLTILGLASLLGVGGFPSVVHAQPSQTSSSRMSAEDFKNLGFRKFQQRDYQGAIEAYNQAIQLNPNLAIAYNYRGEARLRLGDRQGAMEDFKTAVRINPSLAPGSTIPVYTILPPTPYQARSRERLNIPDNSQAVAPIQSGIGGPDLEVISNNNPDVVVVKLGDYQPQDFRYRQGDALVETPIATE